MRVKETGDATAPIARCRNQKKFADKNPAENDSNHFKKSKEIFMKKIQEVSYMIKIRANSYLSLHMNVCG